MVQTAEDKAKQKAELARMMAEERIAEYKYKLAQCRKQIIEYQQWIDDRNESISQYEEMIKKEEDGLKGKGG